MNRKLLCVFVTAVLPAVSYSEGSGNYQCNYGDLQRRVEIFHETGVTVPCEVQYFKDTEAPGQREVLWRALNEAGYCEKKAREFVTKLQGWGWSCTQGAEATVAPEAATEPEPMDPTPTEADDTESLTPVAEPESTT